MEGRGRSGQGRVCTSVLRQWVLRLFVEKSGWAASTGQQVTTLHSAFAGRRAAKKKAESACLSLRVRAYHRSAFVSFIDSADRTNVSRSRPHPLLS